ncbi:MAG: hypothetical protein J6P60_00675, partial [Lachnospiraceae bacterium]|nr:hypothetical protein [Lachnospiraceae bacterium]
MSFLWQIKDEVNRYWGVGALGVLFLCFCLFFLLDKEKNRAMKVYLCYAGFVVLGIANPVSLYVLEKTNNMGVFERLFWLFLSPV